MSDPPNGIRARLQSLEDRLDRFESRTERELSDGSKIFTRREVFDRMEMEIKADLSQAHADIAEVAAEVGLMRREQREQFHAIKNGIVIAIVAAIASGIVSFLVWVATR